MKTIHSMIAAIGLAFVLPTAADAGVNDPEVIVYRFPGVLNGTEKDAPVPAATVFHCTNFSGVPETLRFVMRTNSGALATNVTASIDHLATITVATKATAAYRLDLDMGMANPITQGTMAIAATSTNIICTAMTILTTVLVPDGVALRGIRFSPIPGSQE